ncbi:3079_t:CDS:2 [Gigaspora rosea]|nr:3079_t:CDS:2 [Gigaspora rosea]
MVSCGAGFCIVLESLIAISRNFYICACLEDNFGTASAVLSTELVDFGIALE